eukprot:2942059-Alexandrium_andersonii.AAC.1
MEDERPIRTERAVGDPHLDARNILAKDVVGVAVPIARLQALQPRPIGVLEAQEDPRVPQDPELGAKLL